MTVSVINAEAEAAAARARLGLTLSTLQARIAPKALAQEAVHSVVGKGQAIAERGVSIARRNPLATAGAAVAMALFFVRKPIAKLLTRADDATSAAPDSLPLRKPRAVKRKSR